jgi:hypothetical protein
MLQKIFRVLMWTLLLAVLLAGTVFLVAWKSPKYYTITTTYNPRDSMVPFAQYEAPDDGGRPYVVQAPGLIIFGAHHTRDPESPQIAQMEQAWRQLRPTVALVEGRLGFLLPGVMDPVKELGEGGKIKELAGRDGIPLYNWDLSKEQLAAGLKERFSPEQIALSQILNPYFSNIRFGKPADPEGYIKPYLKRAAFAGEQEKFSTAADVDRIWKKYFPDRDWRDVSDEYRLPGYLGDMMAFTNDLRNRQLIAAVRELRAKGEKVFVGCGASHAYCVAPAFIKR